MVFLCILIRTQAKNNFKALVCYTVHVVPYWKGQLPCKINLFSPFASGEFDDRKSSDIRTTQASFIFKRDINYY